MAELVGVWFMAGFTFAGFFSLPISGRIPMILVSMIGISSLFFYTKEQLGRIRISVPVMLLLTWICLSYLWSIAPWRTLVGLQYYVVVTVAMICVVSVMSVELVIKGLLRGFYGTILVTFLSLVIQPGKTLVDDNGYRSIHGWFFHKNSMAPYMVMAIAFIVALEEREKVRKRMVFLAGVLIVGSLSATGLIALVLVAGFDYLARHLAEADRARRTTMVVGAVAASMGIAYAVTSYLPEIVGVYGKDATLSGRTDIWASVWRAIEERPLLGYGLDAAFQGPSRLVNIFYTEIGFVPAHAHNGLLDVAITGGVIGLVLTVWIFLAVFRDSFRYAVLGVPFGRAMFVVTAMFLVMSVTEATMGWPNMILIFLFRIVLLRWKAGDVPHR
jgi:O-antigen ligase